ncbi:hypothetical protein D3C81_1935930 [compost metagenome]
MVVLIIDSIMPSFSSTLMVSSPICTLPLAPLRLTSTRSPAQRALRSYSRASLSTRAWAFSRAASRPRLCLRSTLIWVIHSILGSKAYSYYARAPTCDTPRQDKSDRTP